MRTGPRRSGRGIEKWRGRVRHGRVFAAVLAKTGFHQLCAWPADKWGRRARGSRRMTPWLAIRRADGPRATPSVAARSTASVALELDERSDQVVDHSLDAAQSERRRYFW